jgi:hypothetical protein
MNIYFDMVILNHPKSVTLFNPPPSSAEHLRTFAYILYTHFRELVTGIFIDDPGRSTSSSITSNGICRGILIIIDVILKTGFSH